MRPLIRCGPPNLQVSLDRLGGIIVAFQAGIPKRNYETGSVPHCNDDPGVLDKRSSGRGAWPAFPDFDHFSRVSPALTDSTFSQDSLK